MANFPKSGVCTWDTNGDLLCKEQFANMAKLGENCNDATCDDGICFRKEDDKDSYCKYVLPKGKFGCDKEEHTVCSQGLTCSKNKCVFSEKENEETKEIIVIKKEEQWDLDKITKIVLITVGSIVGILLVVLIIILLMRARPSTTTY